MVEIVTESPEERARLSAAERDITLPAAVVDALPQFRPEVTEELSDPQQVNVDTLKTTPAIEPDGKPLQVAGLYSDLGKGLVKLFGPPVDKAGDIISTVGGPKLGAAHRTKKTLQKEQRAREEFIGPPAKPDPGVERYQKKGEIVRPGEERTAVAATAEPPPAPHTAITQAQANAAIDAQVRKQSPRIRPPEISANRALADIVEPRRTPLLSDGLTDFRSHGEKGDAKIPNTGNVYALIESTSQQLKETGAITKATRGRVTEEVTRELAGYIGADPQRLIKAIMGMEGTGRVPIVEGFGLSETIMAARNLLYSEVSKLDGLAELAYRERSDANLVNFRQQLEFVAGLQLNFKGIQTEIGRSLGVFKFPVDPRFGAQRDLDLVTLVNEFGGRKDMDDVVEAYMQLPVGERRAQFAQKKSKFKRFTDAAYEVWINWLLSSVISHVKNTAGVIYTVFGEIPVGLTAATIGKVERAAGKAMGYEYGGPSGHYVTYGDVGAKSFGMLMSITEAFGLAGRSWQSGQTPIAGSKLMDQTQGVQQGRRVPAFSGEGLQATAFWAPLLDTLGSFMTLGRVFTRSLQFEDTLLKVVAQRGKLWELGYRAAREQGLKGDRASDFLAEFMANPPAEAVKEADGLARYISLQEELIKTPGAGIKNIARWGAMRWMVPFIKTPYNGAKVAFEHTPLAPVTRRYKEAIESGDRVQIDTARARMALGTGAALTLGAYCATDQLTGGGPTHPGQREALKRQGWRPYSYLAGTLADGTPEYLSYAWAEPFSTIVGVTCDIVEMSQTGYGEQQSYDEIGVAVGFSFAKNLTSKTYMEGFSAFIAALQDPDRYASGIVENLARSAVPRFAAKLGQLVDPQKRVTDFPPPMPKELRELLELNPGRYPELEKRYLEPVMVPGIDVGSISLPDADIAHLLQLVNEIKAQVPGWSDSLPVRHDLWGRPKFHDKTFGPQWMSPIYRSAFKPNEVDQELHRLRYFQSEHPDEHNDVPMTKDELEFFQQTAGKLSWAALAGPDGVLNDPDYQEKRQQAIGTGQRWDSGTNTWLRNWLVNTIKTARAEAIEALEDHPLLGPGFRAAQEEHEDFTIDASDALGDREEAVPLQ